jgi:abhydrolase domain-containing protein 8
VEVEVRPGRRLSIKQVNAFSDDASSPNVAAAKKRGSISRLFNPLKGSVLFVHGSCACKEQFDDLLLEMEPWLQKQSYVAESFDAFGCGASEKPNQYDAYSERALQEDLLQVYNKVKHPTTNFIVAHSYACSQVIKLVNELDESERSKVTKIVLISGAMPGRDGGHPIMKLPTFLLNWLQPILSNEFRKKAFTPDADPALLELAVR